MPKRAWTLLVAAALVAAPAAVLRGFCAGRSCAEATPARAGVPFCSLPEEVRAPIRAGFYDGRSPELLAVADGDVAGRGIAWPSLEPEGADARVPVVLAGRGVRPGVALHGMGLDDVAPTLADVLGLRRPHPEVRSGVPREAVATGATPRLALEVVWEDVSTARLRRRAAAWPFLAGLMRRSAETMRARAGSFPRDPAALLATIGTGGLPRQHGITGTLLRNDAGQLVRAWGPGAPLSVIATLGDDLDRRTKQAARIGVVAPERSAVGLIGGDWYIGNDRDDVMIGRAEPLAAARALLARGYGRDRVPDLLAVAARGPIRALDDGLERLVRAARRAAGGSVTVVVTATGSLSAGADAVRASRVVSAVEAAVRGRRPVVEAAAPGGLFLDQGALAERSIPEDEVLEALRAVPAPGRGRLFADVFPAIAVSFARYC